MADAALSLLPDAALPNNLPVALTSFVGREREVAALRGALATRRLVTVTGAGGCGKTRLALQAANGVLESFPDGVWWVELAPLVDGALVGAAVAEALGVRPLPGMTDLQAACAYLGSRRALVVLDNCEHLLGACAEVGATILRAAPHVKVLATSRATLGVDGETDWRVASLAGSDAATLFVERAGHARPGFAVTDQEAELVAAVCVRLDGLPLAIELAAARVRSLSLVQLADRLSDRFALLTRGPRLARGRQQTLRASVDWSHDLLSEGAQRVLRRVAVFAGGFTLEAAEQLCDEPTVVDVLDALVDQSLVIADPRDREMRFRLLETVREYGLERLAHAGELEAVRGRHRDVFLALAEQAAPHLESRRAAEWIARLNPESANLTAAIEHALATDPSVALRLCIALNAFWRTRGRLSEASLAQSRALEIGGHAAPALRARVLADIAMRRLHGEFDPDGAQRSATEALTLASDGASAARARCVIGEVLHWSRPEAGRAELARAAALARAAGDDWAMIHANAVETFGAYLQGDHARMLGLSAEVAVPTRRLGDPSQLSRGWFFAGWAAVFDGRLDEAREAAERVRVAHAGVWDPVASGSGEAVSALADLWSGRPDLVLERVPRQLERAVQRGAGMIVPLLMNVLGQAELATGQLEPARERLQSVVALTEGRMGSALSWALGQLADTQRLLGDEAAQATATRAQVVGEQSGNRWMSTRGRLTLARIAAGREEWAAAQQHTLAHLDVLAAGGYATWVPECLDALGEITAGHGAHEDAVRLLAAAERARHDMGSVRVLPEQPHWEAIDARLRDALGDAYDLAAAQGAALTLHDTLEWARRARGSRTRPATGWDALTPTEVKVAELVAQGLTNGQIGERMFISLETVKTHVRHVFAKLDVRSRAQLAALAARRQARHTAGPT